MNYILNGETLYIAHQSQQNNNGNKSKKKVKKGNRPQGYQYYQWHYKKLIQKQESQEKNLKNLLSLVLEEEEKRKKTGKQNYQSSQKHYQGSFYDYNLGWKNTINEKVLRQKQQQNRSKQQYYKSFEQKKQQLPKSEYSLFMDNYKGPIQGWKQHFDHYLKTKIQSINTLQNPTFQPKINPRSRKMTAGLTEKVQDRLLRYGQQVKKKHKQLQLSVDNSLTQKTFLNKQSDLFNRLYHEGQQLNRRKLDYNQQLSFQPKINKLSQQFECRVNMCRKPLYYIKNSLSQDSIDSEKMIKKDIKQYKKGDFKGFMQRNQALINLKKKMAVAYQQQKTQRQAMQSSKCTFSPALNKKSRIIIQNKHQVDQKHYKQIQYKMQSCSIHGCTNSQILQIDAIEPNQISKISGQSSDSLSGYYLNSNSLEQNTVQKKKRDKIQKYYTQNAQVLQQAEQQQQDAVQQRKNIQSHIYTTSAEITSRQNHTIIDPQEEYHRSEANQTANIQEDSIDMIHNQQRQWQSELIDIQNHIEEMMSRAVCLN